MSLMVSLLVFSAIPILSLITLVAIDRATPVRRQLATVVLEPMSGTRQGKRIHVE